MSIVAPGVLHASTCAVLLYWSVSYYCHCTWRHHVTSCSVPFVSIRVTWCLWKTWFWDQETAQNWRRLWNDIWTSSHLIAEVTDEIWRPWTDTVRPTVPGRTCPRATSTTLKVGWAKTRWELRYLTVRCTLCSTMQYHAVPNGITWSTIRIYWNLLDVLRD